MSLPRSILGLIALSLLFAMTAGAHAESLSLSGGDWFIHAAASAGDTTPALAEPKAANWIPARVPGNIQLISARFGTAPAIRGSRAWP